MVSTAAPVFGIQHPIHPPCGHLSDAATVPSTRSAVRTVPEALALRMGGSSADRPTRACVRQNQHEVSLDPQSSRTQHVDSHPSHQPAHNSGCSRTESASGSHSGQDRRATGSSQGQPGSQASEESGRLSRQRCLSYDASMARSQSGSIQSRKSNLYRHSMSNIPSSTLPFPATRQQKQAAITALKKPLQVVTKEKSLIRYTNEGRRYWRWKDVVARVLHICRGASADDYSLLLQTEHWLEACDNKHRYGSNLKPYFRAWLDSDTHQSFFKWLDEGDGMHVDIPERPRKKLDLERVVYCGIERCFFEVSIDKGLFRYQLSKHLVTTDSARNAPPCPPDLGKTMASIRQSTLRSAHPLSPRSSVIGTAHAQGTDAAASSSVPASPVTDVVHAVFSVPLGAEASDCGQGAQDRNGASRCSLSDELQQGSGRDPSPAERPSVALLDACILTPTDHREQQGAVTSCVDSAAGGGRQNVQSVPATPDRTSAQLSANGVEGVSPVSLRAADATVLGFSSSPVITPLDDLDVSRRKEDEDRPKPAVTCRTGLQRSSQRPPGLLTKELRKVAGNPHAQLGEEVAAQVAGMKLSTDSPPSPGSPTCADTEAGKTSQAFFPNKTMPTSQVSRQGGDVRARAPAGTPPAASASHTGEGDAAGPQQQVVLAQNGLACPSPNDMEEYLHWAFGRTPSQILQQPILGQPIVVQQRLGARGPVYTEDQHAGGWLDSQGMLHMRQHGVNSLPSGLTRFPSLTLLTSQRLCRMDGQSCGHSDEDSESLPCGDSVGGSSSGTSPVHSTFGRHHSVHTLHASVTAQSIFSPAATAASPSFAPLPRGFPSMPRLGTDQEGANHPHRFPPILWTMRFPTSSTPDGTMPSYSGGSPSCQGGAVGSGILRHSSHPSACGSDTLRPTLSSQNSGAYKETAGVPIQRVRRMSDSDGNVFTDAHHLSLLSAGMHIATIGPHMRTPSVGTSKELQARHLRSSLDSRVDVSHPRLVSNSAIPVNLKLLDIVETVAAPGGGSSVASAHQAGSYSNEAGEHLRNDGGSGSIVEPETRDLADMLEERMERTGQLVKVTTQAQLEDLLPCAPKVLSHTKSEIASDSDAMHSTRTRASSALAPDTDISSYLRARSSRFYSSQLSLPTPPTPAIAAAAALAGANAQDPAAVESRPSIKSVSSASLTRGSGAPPRAASGGLCGPVTGRTASKEMLPSVYVPSMMPAVAEHSEPAAQPTFAAHEALPPQISATLSRGSGFVSAAPSISSVAAAAQCAAAATGSKDRVAAAPAKEPGTEKPPEKREKWIYVWDMHSRLYINRKMPGRFHHSSFVAGGAVKAAGSIVVEDGNLKQITTWSGHYRPRESDISAFLEWLRSKGVSMETVELLVVKPHKPHKAPKGGNPPPLANPQLPPQAPPHPPNRPLH